MIDWVKEGDKILARPGLSAREKSLMEAHLGAARLSAQTLAEAQRAPQREALSLDNLVRALKSEPYNRNVVTDFWATLLTTSDIVQCAYSPEDLKDLAKKDRGPVYIPILSYAQIGEKFPKLGSWAVAKDSPIKDESETVGWADTEIVLEAPNRRTTENQLREKFAKEGRVGARLKVGILASEASKLLVGHYFDEGATWSRYLGSRGGGRVVDAHFDSDGYLHVHSHLGPEHAHPGLGGRSEGVK